MYWNIIFANSFWNKNITIGLSGLERLIRGEESWVWNDISKDIYVFWYQGLNCAWLSKYMDDRCVAYSKDSTIRRQIPDWFSKYYLATLLPMEKSVSVCVCIYVCIYVCLCVYIYIYIHPYIHNYIWNIKLRLELLFYTGKGNRHECI